MSFSILGYDVTGSWSLQEYSPQKGHTVRLYTSLIPENIVDIQWTIYQTRNVVTYQGKHVIHHVFQKECQGSLVDGEGWVRVSCRARYRHHKISDTVVVRDFLVVPEIQCQIQLEQWPTISSDTRFVDLEAYLLCSALFMGSPFGQDTGADNQEYACGGACLDSCPQYEVIATPIKGKRIRHYGRHTVSCNVFLRGTLIHDLTDDPQGGDPNENCVALYRDNNLGKLAKYPPIAKEFSIFPRESEVQIVVLGKKNGPHQYKRLFDLQGLSKHMVTEKTIVTWKFKTVVDFSGLDKKLKKKVIRHSDGQVKCKFPTLGTFEISAVIRIHGIDEVTRVSCRLTILHDQEDVVEYPTNHFTHTIA